MKTKTFVCPDCGFVCDTVWCMLAHYNDNRHGKVKK